MEFAGAGRSCSRFACSVAPSSSAAGSASSKAGQSLNSGAAPNRRVAWSRAKGGLVAKSSTCSASLSSSAAGSPLLAIDASSNRGSSNPLNLGAAPNGRVACSREKLVVIREKLAELYESAQQWSKAAKMLSGIDLDLGIRMLDDTNKLSKCVQIARLYLEDDDAVNAEAFINKASFLVTNSHQEVLNLQYKVCYARILDLKRRFLEAALRYYDISQIEQRKIGDEEIDDNALVQVLSAAVTCTILVGAGPQRSHVLATLYKDERCSKLKIYPILQKVYLERILRKLEIDAFAEEMRPHQKALLPDKSIVLDRAMIEHNCLSASKLYTNIREIDRNALEQALSAAVTCTVLSVAGLEYPHLATLYKDERCSKLKIYPILQKIYLERILRKQEIDAFAEELRPHQKALLPDKSTVPDGAMIKNNLLSASKLYKNISFDEVGTWLGIHPRKAEKIASQMIYDDRMQGSIDQVEAVIHFDDDTEELQQWDQQIATGYLCTGAVSCVVGVAPSRIARAKRTSVVKFASEVRAAPSRFFGPTAGSCRGKTRISATSASASASAPALDWENIARLCLVCALLHKAGYFKLPAPTQSQLRSQSPLKAQIWKKVTLSLLIYCLVIGYYAALGDKRMEILVDAADKGVKCYKVIQEITKIFK